MNHLHSNDPNWFRCMDFKIKPKFSKVIQMIHLNELYFLCLNKQNSHLIQIIHPDGDGETNMLLVYQVQSNLLKLKYK